jgi:hypothetical protein
MLFVIYENLHTCMLYPAVVSNCLQNFNLHAPLFRLHLLCLLTLTTSSSKRQDSRLVMCGVTGWRPFDNDTVINAPSGVFFANSTAKDLMAVAHG